VTPEEEIACINRYAVDVLLFVGLSLPSNIDKVVGETQDGGVIRRLHDQLQN
jgi:hypothetical protein